LHFRARARFRKLSDPRIDDIIAKVASTIDPDKRRELIREEQKLLREVWPHAYVVSLGDVYGVANHIPFKARSDEFIWLYPVGRK
jgi:hypothetical protein